MATFDTRLGMAARAVGPAIAALSAGEDPPRPTDAPAW
jgi:hypothetical protein